MKFVLSIAFLLLVSATVPARGSPFDVFFGGSSRQDKPKPTKSTGFNLDDALGPDPKLAGGTVAPSAGCNLELVQTLKKIIENQDDELRLLKQLTAPKSRFYPRN